MQSAEVNKWTIGRLQKGRGDKQNDRGVHGGENAKRRRRSVA